VNLVVNLKTVKGIGPRFNIEPGVSVGQHDGHAVVIRRDEFVRYNFERGIWNAAGKRTFQKVFDGFISLIPGKIWASTPDLLKKHGFTGGEKK
jgi:hypothetical protein